jgi:hypothetical protein
MTRGLYVAIAGTQPLNRALDRRTFAVTHKWAGPNISAGYEVNQMGKE